MMPLALVSSSPADSSASAQPCASPPRGWWTTAMSRAAPTKGTGNRGIAFATTFVTLEHLIVMVNDRNASVRIDTGCFELDS